MTTNIEKNHRDMLKKYKPSKKNLTILEKLERMEKRGLIKKPGYNEVPFNHKII